MNNDDEGKLINQVKLTLPPSKTDEAYVMNYSTLPPFHDTITQVPKENIPICKFYYSKIKINHNLLTMNKINKVIVLI